MRDVVEISPSTKTPVSRSHSEEVDSLVMTDEVGRNESKVSTGSGNIVDECFSRENEEADNGVTNGREDIGCSKGHCSSSEVYIWDYNVLEGGRKLTSPPSSEKGVPVSRVLESAEE
ncbi:hypothetical protein V6N13_064582 [Hibiscus sabdariffa]